MNDNTDWLEILKSRADSECDSLSKPFGVKSAGGSYSAASDGKQLFMVRLDLGLAPNKWSADPKMILDWTNPKSQNPVLCTVKSILDSLQIKQSTACNELKKCDECDGFGEIDCECVCEDAHEKECDTCEGLGKVSGLSKWHREIGGTVYECGLEHSTNGHEEWAKVELFGKHFDAWTVFKVLRGLPDQAVLVEHEESTDQQKWSRGRTAIHSKNGLWTAVLMPLAP